MSKSTRSFTIVNGSVSPKVDISSIGYYKAANPIQAARKICTTLHRLRPTEEYVFSIRESTKGARNQKTYKYRGSMIKRNNELEDEGITFSQRPQVYSLSMPKYGNRS